MQRGTLQTFGDHRNGDQPVIDPHRPPALHRPLARLRTPIRLIPLVTTLVVATCASGAAAQSKDLSLFAEATRSARLDFQHDPQSNGSYFMPEIMGSGGGFLDYDNDGDLDIYLIQARGRPDRGISDKANRLLRQESNGTFTDVTATSGLGDAGYGTGVAVGDINNDGYVDVFVTNYGPDVLYVNDGSERFHDMTAEAGIAGDAWSASAVFCDYDQDGFLDLYVTHYLHYEPDKPCFKDDGSPEFCSPQVFPGESDGLYRNNGDLTFTDVSQGAGIREVSDPGLGVICSDFNGDGRPDFYVANDGTVNQLWVNQGDSRFIDEAILKGVALNSFGRAEAGMGVTKGDVDGDGDLDLFLTHLTNETNTIYLNRGKLGFDDGTSAAGLSVSSLPRTGFGTGFIDYDHDGDLDLAVVNGRVLRYPTVPGARLAPYWNPYAEPNLLLRNEGRGKFADVSASAGPFASHIEISRGLAIGDIDSDGDLDLLVTNTAGPARLFRNDARKLGHWLIVRTYEDILNLVEIGE